jgi:hypothetical protein
MLEELARKLGVLKERAARIAEEVMECCLEG